VIRRATIADLPRLAELTAEVQALHRAAMPEKYTDPTVGEIEERLREAFATPDLVLLVTEVGSDVVGYAMVKRIEQPRHTFALPRVTAHVDQLGVAERARRGGHGRALMAAVEAQARAWDAVAVTLDVQAFNTEAIAFYGALGYDIPTLRMSKAP
jgi:ribosomal protein S18 acetylase RimI-like enzyme